jgi:hypothetical protein
VHHLKTIGFAAAVAALVVWAANRGPLKSYLGPA